MIKTDKIRSVGTKYHIKLAIPISLLVTLLLLFAFNPVNAQTLRIYHIDVEQADATLIISPSGKTLLIDSGKNGQPPELRVWLKQEGYAFRAELTIRWQISSG